MDIPSIFSTIREPSSEEHVVNYVAPSVPTRTSDDAFTELVEGAGVSMNEVRKEVDMENAAAQKERIASIQEQLKNAEMQRASGKIAENTMGAIMGTGVAFRELGKNIYNGLVTLADGAENLAAQHGIGSGELITEADKWQDSYGEYAAREMGTSGEISRAVTHFAAPLLTTMATGGGALTLLGTNAAYNFLALDPKQSKVTDFLKLVGLNEVPAVSDVVDFLTPKIDDSELTGRFKNAVAGAGIDTAIGGMLWGASRVYTRIKQARAGKVLDAVEQELAKMKGGEPGAPIPTVDEKVPNMPTTPAVVKDTPEQMDLFDKQWATFKDEGTPGVVHNPDTGQTTIKLADDQVLESFNTVAKLSDANVLYSPMTDKEALAAANIMKNDPDVLVRVASWGQGERVPTTEETLVLKYILNSAEESLFKSLEVFLQDISNPAANLKFAREFDNYLRIVNLKNGVASAKGAGFRAEQILANLAGTTEKEALAMLGAEKRAELVNGLLDNYGGQEKVQQLANNIGFLRELSKVAKVPNEKFIKGMTAAAQKSNWSTVNDAVTTVALNGMLSSPGTLLKALLTNAITTHKTIIDNYVQVAIGTGFKTENAKTLAEANAHLSGVYSGFIDAMVPAWNVVKTGTPTVHTRLDLSRTGKAIETTEEVLEKSAGAFAAKVGLATDVLTAKKLPVRVLMGVDTYWQMANYRGFVKAEAIKAANTLELTGDEAVKFVQNFMDNPPKAVSKAADLFAATNTMAKNLDGIAATVDKLIDQSGRIIPFVRVVMPFVKTNLNVIEYTIQNSPFAPFFSPQTRDAFARGGRARDEALAKIVSGSTVFSGFVYMASQGMITGRETLNPDLARAMKDNKTVAPPTSIKVGDSWVSVQGIEPLASLVNMAAMFSKAAGYVSEDEYADAAKASVIMLGEVITPEQLTQSFSGMLNVMAGKEDAKSLLLSIPTRFVPYGGLINDARQTTDKVLRNTKYESFVDSLTARFQNMVPYLSKQLAAQRNVWGEVLLLPDGLGPDAISPLATTEDKGMKLKQAFSRMEEYAKASKGTGFGLFDFNVAMPSDTINNPWATVSKINGQGAVVRYKLDPHQYSAYVMLSAGINPETAKPFPGVPTLKEVVYGIMDKYKAFDIKPQEYDPRTYASLVGELSKAFTVYKNEANNLILKRQDVMEGMRLQAEQFRVFKEMDNER